MRASRLDTAVAVARALGHPARLRAVAALRLGELCVCQITAMLKLAPSTVSLHLRELKRCGVVSERKEGRWVFIALSAERTARSWVTTALAAARPDPRLEADERLVAELRELPVAELCRFGYEAAKTRSSRRGRKTGKGKVPR